MKFWFNPSYYWLRWILVLPFAVLALVLGEALINLFNYINVWFFGWKDNSPYVLVANVIAAGCGGFYFIGAGSMAAPMHKRTTGLILLVLLVAAFGFVVFISIQSKNWKALILAVASIIGAIAAYKNVENEFEG